MVGEAKRRPRAEEGRERRAGTAPGGAPGGAADGPRGRLPSLAVADSLLRCLVRLSYEFGRPLSEAEVRGSVPFAAQVMTPDEFCRAAGRLHYRIRRERGPSAAALAEMPLPAVLVGRRGAPARVALGHGEEGLVLFDGGTGETIELPYGSAAAVAEEAILVKPKAQVLSEGPGWRVLAGKRVRGVLRELLLASLVINVLSLALPLFTMTVFNKVVGQQALDTLTVLTAGMLIVFAFEGTLRIVRGYVAAHTGARLDSLIGSEVMHHFLALPFARFEAQSAGVSGLTDVLERIEGCASGSTEVADHTRGVADVLKGLTGAH